MPIIVVDTEKNFAALRPRLFRGRVSRADAQEVAAAIREANPHADLDKLAPGTVLTVPDLPAVRLGRELALDETTARGVEGLAELGKQALAGLMGAAEKQTAEARKSRAQVLKAMDKVADGRPRPRDARASKAFASARKAFDEEDDRAKKRAATLKAAQAEWTEGLDELKEHAARVLPTG
jgi:hypothetical protein